jgi:hypothetical protein
VVIESDPVFASKQMSVLLANFRFLTPGFTSISSFGSNPFYIYEIEKRFNFLLDDYVFQRSSSDGQNVKKFEFTEGKNKNFNLINSSDRGSIQIVELRNDRCQNIKEINTFPITNCFIDSSLKSIYILEVNGSYEVNFNRSIHFANSNHIRILYGSNIVPDVCEYYCSRLYSSNDRHVHLVPSESYSITGVKPLFFKNVPSLKPTVPVGFDLDSFLDDILKDDSLIGDFKQISEILLRGINSFTSNEDRNGDNIPK